MDPLNGAYIASLLSPDATVGLMNAMQRVDKTMALSRSVIMLLLTFAAIVIVPITLTNYEAKTPRREIKILFWLLFAPFLLTLLVNIQLAVSHYFAPYLGHHIVAGTLRDGLTDYILAALGGTGMALICLHDKTARAIGLQQQTWRPTRVDREHIVSEGLIVGLAGTTIAFWVFFNFNYKSSLFVREFNQLIPYYSVDIQRPLFLALMIKAVIYEELFYRVFIQGLALWALLRVSRLSRREAAMIAVLFSALLWTWAHSRSFEFPWAKYLQIFPLGIALGFLAERRGLWACLLAHFVHNSAILFYKAVFHYLPPL